jgi:exosortase H (IPTLxxWG-CTERM-specific)
MGAPKKSRIAGGAGPPLRFALGFAVCFLVGIGLLLVTPVHGAVTQFSSVLVKLSQGLIAVCGGKAAVAGPVLRDPASGFSIEMKDGCNAVNVTLLLWAAMVAFPAGWRPKALGLVAGSLIIQGINVVRFISLFYLGQFSAPLFEFAHGYLWESLLVLDTMVIFWLWVNRVSRPGAVVNAR